MISPLRQAEMLERAQGWLLGQLAGDALVSLVGFQTPQQSRRGTARRLCSPAGVGPDGIP